MNDIDYDTKTLDTAARQIIDICVAECLRTIAPDNATAEDMVYLIANRIRDLKLRLDDK